MVEVKHDEYNTEQGTEQGEKKVEVEQNTEEQIMNSIKENMSDIKEDMSNVKEDVSYIKKDIIDIKVILDQYSKALEIIQDKDNQIKGLLELNQRLIHEQLGTPNSHEVINTHISKGEEAQKKKDEKKKKPNHVIIEKHDDDNNRVSGNTYPHRTIIKNIDGAKFDYDIKAWIILSQYTDDLIKLLKENNVEFVINL